MSHRQTWSLSQDAHKASGVCSHCQAIRQLHLKDGTIHRHGPRNSPCPGSDKPPLAGQQPPITGQSQSAALSSSSSPSLAVTSTVSHESTVNASISSSLTSVISSALSTTTTIAVAPVVFSHPQNVGALIKHIPKSARPSCATLLSTLLLKVSSNTDDLQSWTNLLGFGARILQKPARTGQRHNLTTIIKKRISAGDNGSIEDRTENRVPCRKRRDADELMAAAVSAKIEDGNIKAAIRILCSEEKPATDTEATFTKLLDRHPAPPSNRGPAPDPNNITAIQVTEAEVMASIRSFPAGSSGGPDGIRPQHVLDLVSCRETGPALLAAITALVNSLLEGKCNPAVAPILFGGQLMALEKKTGGIRPIAIGYTWRRIAAKCANAHATAVLADYLQPTQLGVGTPGGCEAAVHATRRFTESMPAGHCVAKLDFSNAFNSLHRDAMLKAVRERIPGIYKFCHLSYSQPSVLAYAGRTILSQEGPQQGDPLGAALFCNTVHPLLTSLSSELAEGYMDDLTIGGPEPQVARDVETVRIRGRELGLELNDKKCEFVSSTAVSTEPVFRNFIHLTVSNAELLGAPLTTGEAMDRALTSRCDDLSRAATRLRLIAAHDALILLRASFSAPKLLHTLRASPCDGHPALEKFDGELRSCICSITNTDLTVLQWVQASLPVRNGGLGIRRVSSLASSAFLASAAGTRDLQARILSRCQAPVDSAADRVMAAWTSRYNQTGVMCPVGPDVAKQRKWDAPSISVDLCRLMTSLPERRHQARLLAVAAPHSGDWLHALPISSCGLRLDDEAVRVAVGLRLGSKLCEPHQCPCGARVEPDGIHGLACRRSAGRSTRHHVINDLVWRALGQADIPAVKEPDGLLRSDGKRPDGLTLIPWQGGRCMAWDVTVTDTLAESYLATTSTAAGGAAEGAASRKELKYQALTSTHTFIPLAIETLGPINTKGITFIKELGRRLATRSGDKRETAFFYQRLSIAIQRFNSICFHGSFAEQADTDS